MREFRKHIEEAIVINFKRLPLYARKTWGYSIPISLGLIFFEFTIWPLAFIYDLGGKKWYRPDRKVLEDDFISMDKIAPWDKNWSPKERAGGIVFNPGLFAMRVQLFKFLFKKNKNHKSYKDSIESWKQADLFLVKYREQLQGIAPYQLYLYKHFLESIHRSLRLSHLWLEDDSESLERFMPYRRGFVLIQTLGLEYCVFLDILAYPLYKRGIGIIKNDVPHIPLPE